MDTPKTNETDYQRIVKLQAFKGLRYIIVDPTTGVVIDDAQGHGFRTEANAEAYAKVHGWQIENLTSVESTQLF